MPLRVGSLLCICAIVSAAAIGPARAALGGDETSVEADRVQMKAELRTKTTLSAYTVNEIQTPAGTTVREYISAEGKVFAVSWRGPTKPDLRALLGSSFDVFVAAAKSRGSGSHSHLQINHRDLVMRSAGHMRAFSGRAYIPSLVPADISVEDLE